MSRFSSLAASLAAAFIAFAVPVAASAAQPGDVTVSTQGLDLTTPAGVAGLRHRVSHAALIMCIKQANVENAITQDQVESCRVNAVQDATPQLQQAVAQADVQEEARLASIASR